MSQFAPDGSRPTAPAPRPRALTEHNSGPLLPQPRPRRRRVWLPLLIVGLTVCLLVGAGLTVWWQVRPQPVTQAPTGPATTASDAVAGYLHALSEGDVATALSYGQAEPIDQRFLTSEVLQRSREVAPISNIEVTHADDPDTYQVFARYRLGDQPIEATFGVVYDGERWLLLDTTASLSVADLRQRNLPIEVNGVPVGNSNELTVFPGAYALDTGLPRLNYGSDNITFVSAPGRRQRARDLTPQLTEQGHRDMIAAARSSLAACVARADADPEGCPFGAGVPAGSSVVPDSVRWELIGDPFAEAHPTLEWTDHGVVELPVQVRLLFRATVRTGSSEGRVEQELSRNSTAVAVVDDDPLQITWR